MAKVKRLKYDVWFLVVLAVILWSLATQLFNNATVLGLDLTNIHSWARTIATGLAVYGAFWILQIYLRSLKAATKKGKRGGSSGLFGEASDQATKK